MKSTTILLDDDLLLEVQQLAKERHTTASQVIQQALAEYVTGQHPDVATAPMVQERSPRVTPSDSPSEPVEPREGEPESVSLERGSSLLEGEKEAAPPVWVMWAPLVSGGISALAALVLLVLAAGQLAGGGRSIEVVANYLLPGILLGVVAAGSFFVASQSWQAHHAEREDSEV